MEKINVNELVDILNKHNIFDADMSRLEFANRDFMTLEVGVGYRNRKKRKNLYRDIKEDVVITKTQGVVLNTLADKIIADKPMSEFKIEKLNYNKPLSHMYAFILKSYSGIRISGGLISESNFISVIKYINDILDDMYAVTDRSSEMFILISFKLKYDSRIGEKLMYIELSKKNNEDTKLSIKSDYIPGGIISSKILTVEKIQMIHHLSIYEKLIDVNVVRANNESRQLIHNRVLRAVNDGVYSDSVARFISNLNKFSKDDVRLYGLSFDISVTIPTQNDTNVKRWISLLRGAIIGETISEPISHSAFQENTILRINLISTTRDTIISLLYRIEDMVVDGESITNALGICSIKNNKKGYDITNRAVIGLNNLNCKTRPAGEIIKMTPDILNEVINNAKEELKYLPVNEEGLLMLQQYINEKLSCYPGYFKIHLRFVTNNNVVVIGCNEETKNMLKQIDGYWEFKEGGE